MSQTLAAAGAPAPLLITVDALTGFVNGLLHAQQVPGDIAHDVAAHLVASDCAGYASHGVSILPGYARAMADGHLQPQARPGLLVDGGAFQAWHGHHAFGQHAGRVAVASGIAAARTHGHCILTLRDSHHLGRMGSYGEQAAQAGLIMLAFTNITGREPMVAPWGGAQARLTTNPLCFAVPLPGGRPPLILDMATSAIALNRARVMAANGETAPAGALVDAQGRPSTDPAVVFADPPGALMPFGAHKGYGLGVVTELVAGLLSGGGTIQPAHPRGGLATNNLLAVIIDPARMGVDTGWQAAEAQAFIDYLLGCPPAPGGSEVQYPGEYEARNRARHGETVPLAASTWTSLEALAGTLGVAVPAAAA